MEELQAAIARLQEELEEVQEELQIQLCLGTLMKRALKKTISEHGDVTVESADAGIDNAPELVTFTLIEEDGELVVDMV